MSTDNPRELTYQFPNLAALKNAFMPFVSDGGIFIPTEEQFHLGEAVKLTVTLPGNDKVFSFYGEIIWITPKSAHGGGNPGIGIHSGNSEGEAFQKAAQALLSGMPDDNVQSETL